MVLLENISHFANNSKMDFNACDRNPAYSSAAAAGTGPEGVVDKRRANRQGAPLSGCLPIFEEGSPQVIVNKPRTNFRASNKGKTNRTENWDQVVVA